MVYRLGRRVNMEKLQTEHGVFTNNELTGQTAQEVYDEWLLNKDKPPQPTEIERLKQQFETQNQAIAELTMMIAMGGM